MEFINHAPRPNQLLEHLKLEKPQHFETLDKLSQDIASLSDQGERLLQDLQEHMMKCGVCLETVIKSGLLIPIEDYWQLSPSQVEGIPSHLLLNYN